MAGEIQLNSVSLATESSGTVTLNSSTDIKGCINASGSAPIYACRAWINFDGTSASIGTGNANGNVSGVADNGGTGDYTITFATAMADANYSVVGTTGFTGSGVAAGFFSANRNGSNGNEVAPTSTSVRVNACSSSGGATDNKYINVAIFR